MATNRQQRFYVRTFLYHWQLFRREYPNAGVNAAIRDYRQYLSFAYAAHQNGLPSA